MIHYVFVRVSTLVKQIVGNLCWLLTCTWTCLSYGTNLGPCYVFLFPGIQAAYRFMGTHQQKQLCTGIGFCCYSRGSLVTRIFQSLLSTLNFHILEAVRYCWILWNAEKWAFNAYIQFDAFVLWWGLTFNFILCFVCQISPIQSLVGRTGRRWVMGVISQLEDGHFYLEDLSASVEINLSNAISFSAWKIKYFMLLKEVHNLVKGF